MSMQRNNNQGGPMRPGGPMGALGRPVEKAKDFKGTLRRFTGYFAPYKFQLAVVLVTAILSTVFMIVGPKIMGMATTKLFEGLIGKYKALMMHQPAPGIDFTYIGTVLLFLLGLYVLSSIFGYIQQYVMASVGQRTVYRLRKEVDEKLSRLPLKYFDGRPHGEILSRAVNDMDNISTTLQQSLTQLITSVVTLVGVIVMMFSISWLLAVIVILTLPLSLVVTMGIAKRSQTYFRDQQRSLGILNGHVEEMYTGHKIVKSFGYEKKSLAHFAELNEKLYEAGWRAQFASGIIMPLMRFIGNIGYVFVSVVGGILVTQGTISIGDVQAFIQYAQQFTQPITQLANFANVIQSTMASAERIFELLDEQEEIPEVAEAKVIESSQGAVTFEHVRFGYNEDSILMEDMNINVQPGQMIAIVGPTGAGKTTLVNLLMRFYELNGGRITVDGVDITELKRGALRRTFGMVLQDTWLFNGTIRDNIAYGRDNASEEEIVQASKAAYSDHFIRTLPDGYDTILNEEATNISQGQRQLLTIARAFLADPEILILDEATSSVDTRTEMQIQTAMSELMKGRTSFVIAHRLSTIRDADLILVMNHGTIIEQGTHKELLEQNGFYADLYNSQFTGRALQEEAV
ncbi:ABC transporter ATP-binding protein [Ktedonospora formicarum]|uniref:ABC transporter ATP-binding protein n=1 Tax=Ktedonospora formicarum TaxID=2778364 RepID=A0A8J3I0F5_9CHLR|nr:ABC transporter ATP-binding protein [Ktedonospora formicarum]GHO46521.1 ABC transporter ATP-binding protein [Ktedonospora formicarum]